MNLHHIAGLNAAGRCAMVRVCLSAGTPASGSGENVQHLAARDGLPLNNATMPSRQR
jgi:hypothetical protein